MNIIVTGGASGLGSAITQLLAREHNVIFTYSSSEAAARAMEADLPNTRGIRCDFRDADSVAAFVEQIPALAPDALVNNAWAGMHKEHFYKTSHTVFADSFEHNVIPTLRITAAAIRHFRSKKFGKIINIISSAVVNKPPTGWAEYAANKAYLLAMSKSWATEYIKYNITSNSISPAFMLTQLTSDTDERIIEQMIDEHPLKKLLSPDEVADAVAFFVKASQQVNGAHLVMNAGVSLG